MSPYTCIFVALCSEKNKQQQQQNKLKKQTKHSGQSHLHFVILSLLIYIHFVFFYFDFILPFLVTTIAVNKHLERKERKEMTLHEKIFNATLEIWVTMFQNF